RGMKYFLNERQEPRVRAQTFKLRLDVDKNEEVIGFLEGFFQPRQGLLVFAEDRVNPSYCGSGYRSLIVKPFGRIQSLLPIIGFTQGTISFLQWTGQCVPCLGRICTRQIDRTFTPAESNGFLMLGQCLLVKANAIVSLGQGKMSEWEVGFHFYCFLEVLHRPVVLFLVKIRPHEP